MQIIVSSSARLERHAPPRPCVTFPEGCPRDRRVLGRLFDGPWSRCATPKDNSDANQHHASADQDYAEMRKLEARRSEHGKKVLYNVHKNTSETGRGGVKC